MTSGSGTTTFEGVALSNLYINRMWTTDPACAVILSGDVPVLLTTGSASY